MNKNKNNKSLNENELKNVSGGSSCGQTNNADFEDAPDFDSADDKNYLYQIGEEVRFSEHPNALGSSGTIYNCRINSRTWLSNHNMGAKKYKDYYTVEGEGVSSVKAYNRKHFVKK